MAESWLIPDGKIGPPKHLQPLAGIRRIHSANILQTNQQQTPPPVGFGLYQNVAGAKIKMNKPASNKLAGQGSSLLEKISKQARLSPPIL